MRRSAARSPLLLVALACTLAVGCDGCKQQPPALARLTLINGDGVKRDFARTIGRWQAAEPGAEFRLGDGLRTDPPSSAALTLLDGSRLRVRPGTIIRFALDGAGPPEQGIDVQAGEALLMAGKRDLELRTHVGLAVIRAGSQLRLTRDGEALGLSVEVGEARFRSASGEAVRLSAGDDVQLTVGMAVLRRPDDRPEQAAPEAAPDAGAASAAAPTEEVQKPAAALLEDGKQPGPDYANFGARAGESFTVHAPEVPVAIAFDFGHKCKGEGVVELVGGNQRSRGHGSGNLLLPRGTRTYAVRCLDARGAPGKVVARGTVHVLQDAGTRKLPPRAPTSLVEADGRNYTIYYQNQQPEVRVRWPNAPAADVYLLDVDGTKHTLKAPEHLFRSGALRDGVHRLTFEAKGRRSRTATVEVRFDNAAPTASLAAPADRAFAPGDTVQIEGVALPAWKVSVQGGTIDKSGDDRFVGQVVTSAQQPDIAVRLSHPRLGTHYYLRRSATSR